MSHGESRTEYCPVCGERFPLEILNAHANTHFASATPSPVYEGADPTWHEVDYLPPLLEDRPSGAGRRRGSAVDFALRLPTAPTRLAEVQTMDAQFRPGLNSLRTFAAAYAAARPPKEGDKILCISGAVQHFGGVVEDKGWGCGYRNCQMLISHLLSRGLPFVRALFGGVDFVPDIPSLQAWLESAWKEGFDPAGKHSLQGQVQGTSKWIGAVDIVALLRQFGVRARFLDFLGRHSSHHPDYEGGTVHEDVLCDFCKTHPIVGRRYTRRADAAFDLCEHCVQSSAADDYSPFNVCGRAEIHRETFCMDCGVAPIVGVCYWKQRNWKDRVCQKCYLKKTPLQKSRYKPRLASRLKAGNQHHGKLMTWVWDYFTSGLAEVEGPPLDGMQTALSTNKAPLYFQHDGHSRTIVGIERCRTTGRQGDTTYSLIIFDPALNSATVEQSFERGTWPNLLKRGLHTLRHPEYQLLYIEEGLASGEEVKGLMEIRAQLPILA